MVMLRETLHQITAPLRVPCNWELVQKPSSYNQPLAKVCRHDAWLFPVETLKMYTHIFEVDWLKNKNVLFSFSEKPAKKPININKLAEELPQYSECVGLILGV